MYRKKARSVHRAYLFRLLCRRDVRANQLEFAYNISIRVKNCIGGNDSCLPNLGTTMATHISVRWIFHLARRHGKLNWYEGLWMPMIGNICKLLQTKNNVLLDATQCYKSTTMVAKASGVQGTMAGKVCGLEVSTRTTSVLCL
jgi:hypothetical protein